MNPHTPKATPTVGDVVLVDSQNLREQFQWWLPPSPSRGESNVSVLPAARPNTKGAPIMH